ncbi:MAG: NADPH-dependent FMN reductase [Deltaproteobacteria bacterium]
MPQTTEGPKVVIIDGSVRPGNYTRKAVALVVDEFKKHPRFQVKEINPAELNLPFPGTDLSSSSAKALQEEVKSATAVILATPEYHGSFSSIMKLVIENLGFPSVLAGKPVALLGVAAGSIGAVKSLEHLRGVCSHIGAVVLPLATSVANVQKVFDAEGRVGDPAVEKMIRNVATTVVNYVTHNICPGVALEKIIRQGPGAVDFEALAKLHPSA